MDSLLHLMKRNRGVRKFSGRRVPEHVLLKILEAGSAAPCGAIDGVHIFIIDRDDKRESIHRICVDTEREWLASQPLSVRQRINASADFDPGLGFLRNAPLLLVVSTRPRDPEFPYAIESAFIAIGFMMVLANGFGLIAAPFAPSILHETDVNRLNSILKLPPGESIQAFLPLGYPAEAPSGAPVFTGRNIYLNEFGNKFVPE